jgi:selenophosphate synthetase-related protein
MLCEASSVGTKIDLGKIPKPENIQLSEWLTSYPAMGFIFAINSEKAIQQLREVGLKTEVVGRFTREMKIRTRLGEENQTFIDLMSESIFGLK